MKALELIEPFFMRAMDGMMARIPQIAPPIERLEAVTIFSHRGEHDNKVVLENTLASFEASRRSSVGGIELDIRWTKDLVPVVFHDLSLKRIYNDRRFLSDFSFSRLKQEFPDIPSLAEVVDAFGKKIHLMIELKWESFADPITQQDRLKDELKTLMPVNDFHLMSLTPRLFDIFKGFPSETYLPIARIKAGQMSDLCINKGFGGLTGHYAFINHRMIDRHHKASQRIGTGFATSRNSLFREINRGVDWIFSNHAAMLQNMVNDFLDCGKLSKTN